MKRDLTFGLTTKQRSIVAAMQQLHTIAQEAGIAFALDDDARVVAYNASDITDCFGAEVAGDEDYLELNVNDMHPVFPVWDDSALYVKLKEQ